MLSAAVVGLFAMLPVGGNVPLDSERANADQEWVEVGTGYFMHDGQYLYVGAALQDPLDKIPDDWTSLSWELEFAFEDEPAGGPGAWTTVSGRPRRASPCLAKVALRAPSEAPNL
jgi:hypothetical protein